MQICFSIFICLQPKSFNMKLKLLHYLTIAFLIVSSISVTAQTKKNKPAGNNKNYPAAFTIQKSEFEKLFSYKTNEPVADKANKYLDNSVLLMNTKNGDMKFLKLKLGYFKNAFLLVQVNGTFSTQVFVMSSDKSVFYKGQFEKGNVVMSKCSEDDIVSE